MVILTKIYIIACLLLNFLMCQKQEYPEEYSSDLLSEQSPEAAMPKHPRSGELEAPLNLDQWQTNPIRDSPSQSGICPAESPGDVSYEKPQAPKKSPKKIVRDEDDDEDLDMAAGDDDDEDDDDEFMDGDEINVDDEAFVARISCLMGALDHHAKAITGNVKNIETRLGKLRPQGNGRKKSNKNNSKGNHPKTKWSNKSKYFQDLEECPGPLAFAEESLSQAPAELDSQNRADTSDQRWLPRQEAFESIKSSPEAQEHSHQHFAEYEAKLTRLMANRDAIERNVMKVLGPRQAERL